jgi:membrane protein required for colicin V production
MDGLPINGLDLAVGIVLLISALLAFMRGFVHEVLSIAAWVGAVIASVYGTALAQPISHDIIPIAWAADAVAAVVIFLVVLFTLSMGTHAFAKTIQASALNNLDRTLGFVFGVARAMVILAVGLLLMNWLMDAQDRPNWMAQAKTLPLIVMTADGMVAIIPDALIVAEEMAGSAAQQVEQAVEAKEAIEKLADQMDAISGGSLTGNAGGEAPSESEPGYSEQERDALNALIEDAGDTE